MPVFLGIPLIGWIQMIIGVAVVCFVLVKYLLRPKKRKTSGYLIKNVHVIVGDGSEMHEQNVLIKNGLIEKITEEEITSNSAQVIDGSDMTLMPGLIDCRVHIQGLKNRSDEYSDRFLRGVIQNIFKERVLP